MISIETNKKIIAITGSIGSGKSTFARLLTQLNIPSIDADSLARRALDKESDCFQSIIKLFGESVLTEKGEFNRKLIAKKIFSDQNLKTQLETITHPLVQKLFLLELSQLKCTDTIVTYQIPILFEKNLPQDIFYKIISVCSPRELCIQRAISRSNYSYQLASQIFDSQCAQEIKCTRSDLCIMNHGSLKRLKGIAKDVLSEIQH